MSGDVAERQYKLRYDQGDDGQNEATVCTGHEKPRPGGNKDTYIKLVPGKAVTMFQKLSRLTVQEWRLRPTQLIPIYRGGGVYFHIVCYPVATYPAKLLKNDHDLLRSSQRWALMTVLGAYSTTSHDSCHVIVGVLLIELGINWRRRYALLPAELPAAYKRWEKWRLKNVALDQW